MNRSEEKLALVAKPTEFPGRMLGAVLIVGVGIRVLLIRV